MKRTTLNSGKGQFIILSPLNSRSVSVSSNRIKPLILLNSKDEPIKLVYDNIPIIEKGGQVVLGKELFKISYIETVNSSFILHASKLTKTSYFLLPTIGESRDYFLWSSQFVNSFISTENELYTNHGYSKPCIYILYRFSKSVNFSKFEKAIREHKLYITMYDVDSYHTLYVLKIPESLISEYNLFVKGKYSKFHTKYKDQIISFHNANSDSDLYGILNKTKAYREKLETKLTGTINKQSDIIKISDSAELHDPLNIIDETYLDFYKIKKIMKANVEFE